jgi:hypothetical protein
VNPVEYLVTWWGARRSERRHKQRIRLWLWHKHHEPGPCDCLERIEKLKPKRWRRG